MQDSLSDADWDILTGNVPLTILWIEIANQAAYVAATLALEASDIPATLYTTDHWEQAAVPMRDIEVNSAMLAAHRQDPVHQRRVFRWCQSIEVGRPLLPLIILSCDRGTQYLVDGYARYQALQRLGVETVQVLRQHRAARQ